MYTYKIIKENAVSGQQDKRTRTITRCRPLEVGGLYLHLGRGYPGAHRILELVEVLGRRLRKEALSNGKTSINS